MPAATPVLLRDVRLIDGTGAPPQEHVSLLLQNGRIEKIGETMIVPKGVPVSGTGREDGDAGVDQRALASGVDCG